MEDPNITPNPEDQSALVDGRVDSQNPGNLFFHIETDAASRGDTHEHEDSNSAAVVGSANIVSGDPPDPREPLTPNIESWDAVVERPVQNAEDPKGAWDVEVGQQTRKDAAWRDHNANDNGVQSGNDNDGSNDGDNDDWDTGNDNGGNNGDNNDWNISNDNDWDTVQPEQNNSSCCVCFSDTNKDERVFLPCGCLQCRQCLNTNFRVALSSRIHFPPRCCGGTELEGISIISVEGFLDDDVVTRWMEVAEDFTSSKPIHCPKPDCGRFISETLIETGWAFCKDCSTRVCASCHAAEAAHDEDGGACPDVLGEDNRELIRSKEYMLCPRCTVIVEKTEACDHMSCICGEQFCYRCGSSTNQGVPCTCNNMNGWVNGDEQQDDAHDQAENAADLVVPAETLEEGLRARNIVMEDHDDFDEALSRWAGRLTPEGFADHVTDILVRMGQHAPDMRAEFAHDLRIRLIEIAENAGRAQLDLWVARQAGAGW